MCKCIHTHICIYYRLLLQYVTFTIIHPKILVFHGTKKTLLLPKSLALYTDMRVYTAIGGRSLHERSVKLNDETDEDAIC